MGHDAVADLQHHVERSVRRIFARQPAERARDLDAALEPSSDFEKAPAGEAVHVLVQQAGKSGELAQDDGHGTGRVVARRDILGEFVEGLGKVAQRQPAVGGKAVADLPSAVDGAVERGDQAQRNGGFRVDAERFEIVAMSDSSGMPASEVSASRT